MISPEELAALQSRYAAVAFNKLTFFEMWHDLLRVIAEVELLHSIDRKRWLVSKAFDSLSQMSTEEFQKKIEEHKNSDVSKGLQTLQALAAWDEGMR